MTRDAAGTDNDTGAKTRADSGAATGHRAVVAFGSNLGRREAILSTAADELRALPGTEWVELSSILESVAIKPSGPDPSAPPYLNAVALVRTTAGRDDFFRSLGRIEQSLGRVRVERWGDRTLDLDLIDFDGTPLETTDLTLPHPRAFERLFVLEPWLELDPRAELLGHGPVRELVAGLRAAG